MSSGESIQEELLRRVEENRQLGRYPVGLEEQLEADFRAIMEVVHGTDDLDGFRIGELSALKIDLESLKTEISSKVTRKMNEHHWGLMIHVLERTISVVESVHKEVAQIREEDSRVLRKMNSFVLDRLVMIDVLAQAVVELERKIAEK